MLAGYYTSHNDPQFINYRYTANIMLSYDHMNVKFKFTLGLHQLANRSKGKLEEQIFPTKKTI
jgi:hypothetical protein